MSRISGTVVYYNIGKNWGFVKDDSSARQWFFHCENSPGFDARLGVRATFEIAPPVRLGLRDQAINLQIVEASATVGAESGVDGAL